MVNFLTMDAQEQQRLFRIAAMRSSIPEQQLEHDWWQSFVLRNLFELPMAEWLTLRGGCSLRYQ